MLNPGLQRTILAREKFVYAFVFCIDDTNFRCSTFQTNRKHKYKKQNDWTSIFYTVNLFRLFFCDAIYLKTFLNTSKTFLLSRYPRLYEFFYGELESSSKAIERNEKPLRLHPLLLLISRLYPSGVSNCDTNSKLRSFVPFISTCSSSPELVTRKLSANSIVALIAPRDVLQYCLDRLKTINVIDDNPFSSFICILLN